MTDPRDKFDLEPEMSHEEREGVARLAERLERERPVPRAAFRGELSRRLFGSPGRARPRPESLRSLVLAYSGSGFVLLLVAALGLAGAGPFAA